jgi:tryptophan synthase alpha chain
MEATKTLNRIDQLFSEKKENILSVFYTAGYPSLTDTVPIAQALEQAGVDMIEIGIPFSDPIADGPVIQASSKTAIDNGMTLKLLLEQVKEARQTVTIPIILMGYLNPVMQYGMEEFFTDAAAAGVDGLILPDMPMDEYKTQYKEKMEVAVLRNVFLISPTTAEKRIRQIDNLSDGFIYAVSSSSTTGARTGFQPEQLAYFERLKSLNLKNPFLIGFGISNQETYSTACQYSAGVIVGSAFIQWLTSEGNSIGAIAAFIRQLKG